jgi:hypothetical protein
MSQFDIYSPCNKASLSCDISFLCYNLSWYVSWLIFPINVTFCSLVTFCPDAFYVPFSHFVTFYPIVTLCFCCDILARHVLVCVCVSACESTNPWISVLLSEEL